jgi:hypothetical protein
LKKCAVCAGSSFESFVDFGTLPLSGSFLERPSQSYKTARLSFEFCQKCGFVRQTDAGNVCCDYKLVGRTTGHRLPPYAENLIVRSFDEADICKDSLIIEVGANDGALADLLAGSGFSNILCVEPSFECSRVIRSKGHMCECLHLNSTTATKIRSQYGPAQVVVCRLTLEHVPEPYEFLTALGSLLTDDGTVFIEVPDGKIITEDLQGHILWDEHLYSFTRDTVVKLLQRAGFKVSRVMLRNYRSTRTILVWANHGVSKQGQKNNSSNSVQFVDSCRSFAPRWHTLSQEILGAASKWPRPIAFIGASHPQSNFLLFTRLGHIISFLVDDDTDKVGRFVPVPQPVEIISSAQLLEDHISATVVRGAFGYDDWMDDICGHLSAKGVHIAEPYCGAHVH